MKRWPILALLAVAVSACGEDVEEADTPSGNIECALAGAGGFSEDCTMERDEREGQSLLIVRHPDGGFRRFELGVPERGMITADGAEVAEVTRHDGFVEVRVGADRYRLPVSQ